MKQSTGERPDSNTAYNELKLAGVAGVLSVLLAITAFVVDPMTSLPATNATTEELTAFVRSHRPTLLVFMFLSTIAVCLWLVFGAGVYGRMRQATSRQDLLTTSFAYGLVCFVTLIFVGFTCFFVLVYRGPAGSDARLLYDLTFGLLAMSGVPTALALGSYAAVVFRTGAMPRYTAQLAVLAALAHLALLASFVVKDGFFSLEGEVIMAIPATLFTWIAATGGAMIRKGRST